MFVKVTTLLEQKLSHPRWIRSNFEIVGERANCRFYFSLHFDKRSMLAALPQVGLLMSLQVAKAKRGFL